MIVVEGCDGTGKTTLAKILATCGGFKYFHFVAEHDYLDFLNPLASLGLYSSVADRIFLSERPYAKTLNRKFKYNPTQWRNLVHCMLAQSPVILWLTYNFGTKREVLKTPEMAALCHAFYLDLWAELGFVECRDYYKVDLSNTDVDLIDFVVPLILNQEASNGRTNSWWLELHRRKCAPTGQLCSPQVLIIADRLGPSNIHELPFEAGPTARLMDEALTFAQLPLGEVCITNVIKDRRGATRGVNKEDLGLFEEELTHIQPKRVVVMGRVASDSTIVLKRMGIPYAEVPHLGYLHRRGELPREKEAYFNHFREACRATTRLGPWT